MVYILPVYIVKNQKYNINLIAKWMIYLLSCYTVEYNQTSGLNENPALGEINKLQ